MLIWTTQGSLPLQGQESALPGGSAGAGDRAVVQSPAARDVVAWTCPSCRCGGIVTPGTTFSCSVRSSPFVSGVFGALAVAATPAHAQNRLESKLIGAMWGSKAAPANNFAEPANRFKLIDPQKAASAAPMARSKTTPLNPQRLKISARADKVSVFVFG
jgi:hypothetical protein